MFESENRKCSNENRKIEIGTIEAEIRIEATQSNKKNRDSTNSETGKIDRT